MSRTSPFLQLLIKYSLLILVYFGFYRKGTIIFVRVLEKGEGIRGKMIDLAIEICMILSDCLPYWKYRQRVILRLR